MCEAANPCLVTIKRLIDKSEFIDECVVVGSIVKCNTENLLLNKHGRHCGSGSLLCTVFHNILGIERCT